MDIYRTHNICHGYNRSIIISMITSGHIPNSLPLALELVSKISNTHRPQVCLMLRLWKSLCQRICNIQIRMYLTHLNFTSPSELPNEVKLPHHMFVLLVIPRLLSLCNCPIVVTM